MTKFNIKISTSRAETRKTTGNPATGKYAGNQLEDNTRICNAVNIPGELFKKNEKLSVFLF